jgi:hypothetical protein
LEKNIELVLGVNHGTILGVKHGTDTWSKLWNWLLEKNIELVLGVNYGTGYLRKT